MLTVSVRLFAQPKDIVRATSIDVRVSDGGTVADLRAAIADAHPRLAPLLPSCIFAVNDTFATDATVLRSVDVVALIPPVSGG